MSKISQEYGGWIGNETSASDFDRKYICYPAISDTLQTLKVSGFYEKKTIRLQQGVWILKGNKKKKWLNFEHSAYVSSTPF